MSNKPDVCIIGGGMITKVQILPSIYHLQRQGVVGNISICALNSQPLRILAEDKTIKKAFPGQQFAAYPALETKPEQEHPDLFRKIISQMSKHNIVIVAVPDHLHYSVVKTALECDQHICCVKPLVLQYTQALEIERLAFEKGLVVGIEYHKRLDNRALMARQLYKEGKFGEFVIGHAEMNEPYYYRHSNFQNWCTCENSDMFTYVGCHYVDQLHFITGLMPKSVSVYGIIDTYPNGKKGYLWTDARVIWENGGVLNVTNIMGYPDDGPGGNYQGLRMYFAGKNKSGMLFHNDQYRGIEHCFITKANEPGDTYYAEPSPDYFKYVYLGSDGLVPVGYGYQSIEFIINNIHSALNANLKKRQKLIRRFDKDGIMATPKNSSYNELVTEAARLSITNNAREVEILYGENASVRLREY